MTNQTGYRKLPGSGRRHNGIISSSAVPVSRLYLGQDHLLVLERGFASESYHRFYFQDIQGIIIQKTSRALRNNIILAVMALICAGLYFWSMERPHVMLMSFTLYYGLFCLAILAANIILGSSCTCTIITAVQTEVLPSLKRLRRANKVFHIIDPLIKAVQGGLTQEMILNAKDIPEPLNQEQLRVQAVKTKIRHDKGTIHLICFWLAFCAGFVDAVLILKYSVPLAMISGLLSSLVIISVIVALARQYATDIPGGIKRLIWIMMGCIGISLCLGYVHLVSFMVKNPKLFESQASPVITNYDLFMLLIRVSPKESLIFMISLCFSAISHLVLGGAGLWGILRFRRRR